jgi:methylmalonyl-CoA/ethylmalonyl-CoA epimerase
MEKIASNRIIKVGVVTDDVEKTYAAFQSLFETLPSYDSDTPPVGDFEPLKYKKYMGKPAGNTPLKVRCVFLDPIYFEIVEPVGEAESPWHDHLKAHGTSVCFISLYIEGFEQHIDLMGKKGFPLVFEEEKGFERYAYFDTLKALGFTLEMKERIPKA